MSLPLDFATLEVTLPSKSPPQFVNMPDRYLLYSCTDAARYSGSAVS